MKKLFFWLCLLLAGGIAFAHPMPSSVVELSVLENTIKGEAKMPLLELANAVGDQKVTNLNDPFFKTYFTEHIQAFTSGKAWTTGIESIHMTHDSDPDVGAYQEVVVTFTLTPPEKRYLRTFTFAYDAIIHQVVTHSALISVRQDWSNGIGHKNVQRVGGIQLDVSSGKIDPLSINLEEGSAWTGFKSMLRLGMQHIKEGTDHLLFLLVLLLPAMLLVKERQWGDFGGLKYSLLRLLKIVTAFTIGHSITLMAGAFGWLRLPGRPVEILIAVSILTSAIHALRPLFPGKETFVAAGFGSIHGLAFAMVLSNLELSAGKLALSILGFNAGIEVMQLLIIAIIIPWLILLSKTSAYKYIRITGGVLAAIAALAWIAERTSGRGNFITGWVEEATAFGVWCIAALAIVSLLVYMVKIFTKKNARLVS